MDRKRRCGIGRNDMGIMQNGQSGSTGEARTRWNVDGTGSHGSPGLCKPTSV